MKKIFFLIFILTVLTSCSNSIYNKNTPFFKGTFLKIEKIVEITVCNPKIPTMCLTRKFGSSASSFLVAHKGNKSYLVTSAHVCHTDYGRLQRLPNFKAVEEFYGVNLKLKKFPYKIVAMDLSSDLCLVSTNRISGVPYKISKKLPKIGDRIYNIAVPQDIFDKDMIPLFEGYYSGTAHGRSIFTLPAFGGSSGSPILNKKGEVVGAVSAVTKNFYNIVIASPLPAIKELIKNGIP
mgnify:CR=1 FL=1